MFGIRHIDEISTALIELYRVTKPGGKLICMEFNYPPSRSFKRFYDLYLKLFLVNMGGFLTHNYEAYQYFVETVKEFPYFTEIEKIIEKSNWNNVKTMRLTFDTCIIYTAVKI